jgi:hypothetical protein
MGGKLSRQLIGGVGVICGYFVSGSPGDPRRINALPGFQVGKTLFDPARLPAAYINKVAVGNRNRCKALDWEAPSVFKSVPTESIQCEFSLARGGQFCVSAAKSVPIGCQMMPTAKTMSIATIFDGIEADFDQVNR